MSEGATAVMEAGVLPSQPTSVPGFLATLRGRRRRLGDMTTRDEEREFKLRGVRFDPWLERWRLAATVCQVPCGVAFAEGPRFFVGPCEGATLTTPDDEVISDKLEIYHRLAKAAVTCSGWMERLSEADLKSHVETVEELGDALEVVLSGNTKVAFESAVASTLRLLEDLEQNADLHRFVRTYRTSASGTHFLDAFYAPIVLRLHVVNCFTGTMVFDLPQHFELMNMWRDKLLSWTLFTSLLGADFATEMIAYYRDRGSHVFNSWWISAEATPRTGAKFVPAVLLRERRLAVCAKLANPAEALAVIMIEADALKRLANVEIRVGSLQRAVNDAPKFALLLKSVVAEMTHVRKHVVESLTLLQLWHLEADIWINLSRSEPLLTRLISSMIAVLSVEGLTEVVAAICQLISIIGDDSFLKDVLQVVYRECNPSDWLVVTSCVPAVCTLVISKENWSMHYKFPAVSLLCAFFTAIKGQVTAFHNTLCSSHLPPHDEKAIVSVTEYSPAILSLRRMTSTLFAALDAHYGPLVVSHERQKWTQFGVDVLAHLDGLTSQPLTVKRFRMQWKRAKKDLILCLRNLKKYLVPKMLRFVRGETLIDVQTAVVAELAEKGELSGLLAQLSQFAGPDEVEQICHVVRSQRPDLFEAHCAGLVPQLAESEGLSWHPKFAGVPFILGLSNRVLLEDLATVVRAAQRSLKGLGELPTADVRNTFEIFFAHYVSHKSILFDPIVSALSAQSYAEEYLALTSQVERLEELIEQAEKAAGSDKRSHLGRILDLSQRLSTAASRCLSAFSSKFVPVCVTAFSHEQSMQLFSAIVQTYHSANPHLLCRTIASLKSESEFRFFCRNMLAIEFKLLKQVLDTVRAEVPSRIWMRVIQTMPCLGGVTIDNSYWASVPNFGGVSLFWRLSHRFIEHETNEVLALVHDRAPTLVSFNAVLDRCQLLMLFLEKHGLVEEDFLLPRIASAAPTIAELLFEEMANEHSLLEADELRVIAILKAGFKAVSVPGAEVPSRQLNRLKRQLRSYQTLMLPHLTKEEEKYLPVMLHYFSATQCHVLLFHTLVLYGELLDDQHVLSLLRLAHTVEEQKRLIAEFLPSYCKFQTLPLELRRGDDIVFPSFEFFEIARFSFEEAVDYCVASRSKLVAEIRRNWPNLFQMDK